MNPNPRHANGDEAVHFEAEINGRPTLIAVEREAIEDHLGRETTTPYERLQFVTKNRDHLARVAVAYIGAETDIDGIALTADQLSGSEA
jgi:hypothetical protein